MTARGRQPRRLAHLLIGPTLVAAVCFWLVAQRLDAGFFHGLSPGQLYALSAAIVLLSVIPIVLLVLALMRVRIMRIGGQRWAVPQEWSAEELRAWRTQQSS
ncbi:MAG: hypothetical protein SF182_11835 [Deltaproteobacteria bacterium]|nr:hypothetical protein [Deltaproteobacteria bacterium]